MFHIYRHINSISLNGREYLLNDEGEVLLFPSIEEALDHLREQGGKHVQNAQELKEYGIYIEEIEDE